MKRLLLQSFGLSMAMFIIAIIAQAFLSMRLNYGVPQVFGYSLLYVSTDSMDTSLPDAIPKGAGIILQNVPVERLHLGDVITFYDKNVGAPNTHRIDAISRKENEHYEIHTLGDNYKSDRFLYEGETFDEGCYIGKVVFVSRVLGKILSAVSLEASIMSGEGKDDFFYLYPYIVIMPLGVSAILVLVRANIVLFRHLRQEEREFLTYRREHGLERLNEDEARKTFEQALIKDEKHEMWVEEQMRIGLSLGNRKKAL